MVKVGTSVNEAIEIDSGKIVYDIKFPVYYNNKEHILILIYLKLIGGKIV